MNDRLEFWKNSIGWPSDNSSCVFLARAVHAFGKSMFGAEWTGAEPCLDLMNTLPVFPEKSGWRASLAHDLLVQHHPEFNRQPRKPLRHSYEFTGQEWMAAVMIVKNHNEQKMPGVRRFFAARDRIIQLAEAGLLITAIREKAGGDPTPIPRAWWNSERIRNRFDLCQMDPDEPYGLGIGGGRHQWIFVTRESLMSCTPEFADNVEQQSGAAEATAVKERDKGGRPREYDWDAVKDYALGLVREHGVPGRNNQRLPSKTELVEAIMNQWAKKDIHLAESTVRRYVTDWLGEL